ncbi:MAG TPA: serine hydrolase domain-containing protein, partial [Acidimicrobiales bacterium]|nr:serine hydrolase domain-containing protein [Acidimicrobiales bacterium]
MVAPSDGERLAALDAARVRGRAPGAIAVVLDGDERWAGAVGDATVDGVAADPSMRFRAASIAKPVVAALVLRSVADGHLALDDLVHPLVGDVLRPQPPITVRQMLDHTSGVFDLGNEGDVVDAAARVADPAQRAQADDLIARALAGESVVVPAELLVAGAETYDRYFEPGTGFHYSNLNYQLAGMVLEAVEGRALHEVLEAVVVRPLGLERTSLAPADRSSPDLRGYAVAGDGSSPVDLTDDLTYFGNGGNGGLLTTADELALIFRALL